MEDSIETIFVKPRNKYYCEYVINDADIHTKTYDDLKDYLYEIIPERFIQINYALMHFQSFIIFVPNKEFIFLQLNDIKDSYDDMENAVKNPSIKDAVKELKSQNKDLLDDKIKKMSELKI